MHSPKSEAPTRPRDLAGAVVCTGQIPLDYRLTRIIVTVGRSGVNVEFTHCVVQLTVRLVAAPERIDEVVGTLQQVVMRPAQQMRGCRFAQVYHWPNDRRHVDYVEEWDELCEFRNQCRSERFTRLLELIEMATEVPDVEVRDVSGVHGLDYIAAQRDSA